LSPMASKGLQQKQLVCVEFEVKETWISYFPTVHLSVLIRKWSGGPHLSHPTTL
jgi:hypothetical protein